MILNKFKSVRVKNTVNPYSRSEYLWTDLDLIKAGIFGAAVGALIALVVYFQWFYEPVVPVFRPLIG